MVSDVQRRCCIKFGFAHAPLLRQSTSLRSVPNLIDSYAFAPDLFFLIGPEKSGEQYEVKTERGAVRQKVRIGPGTSRNIWSITRQILEGDKQKTDFSAVLVASVPPCCM